MKKIAFLIIMCICSKVNACINESSTLLKNGIVIYTDEFIESGIPMGHSFNTEIVYKKGLKQLDSLYLKTKDIDYLSDKGILFILLKRYEDAIQLYLSIEKKSPGRYSTASNLGTAYELAGQNENALKWIKKSVEIDKNSHEKSEWIHIKILEAKIKGATFYTSDFLLNTNFGVDSMPVTKMSKTELLQLSKSLFYQLNERVSFIKPKERIVAQLLFDLGNTYLLLGNYRDANYVYLMARKYGYLNEIVNTRLGICQDHINKH